MSYKVEEYQILSVKTYRLLEEETGEYWYPLSLFLKRILFQQNGATKYRDNPKYNKFMKVISYINPRSLAPNMPNKTWCMNTEGIYLLLQNITINKGSNKERMMKEKYLAAAQNFFGGVIPKNEQQYIGYAPDLTNYDVWSIICLTRDTTLDKNTIWKRCSKCGFYYPNTKKYFVMQNNYLSTKCKQCCGYDFVCENKHLQYIYKNDGLDLIYQLYLNSDNIIDELKKWINKGGV